jgi:hypothetical protein
MTKLQSQHVHIILNRTLKYQQVAGVAQAYTHVVYIPDLIWYKFVKST